MRVCLMVEGQEDVSWDQWLALACACEEAGLEGLFRSDHYLSVFGRRERAGLDAWATLAALAARTDRIRLGTLVSPATFRHPSELAKVVATVDHVSGGRAELGIGAGWNEPEHAAYGFPFPALGTRMDVLEEQLEIVTRSWAEESFTYRGSHYALEECPALPKPLQEPRPPLIIGGSAGPRSVELAARFADEYNVFYATLAECRERRARVLEACERAGRDPATMRFSLMTGCVVGTHHREVLERLRRVQAVSGEEVSELEELLASRAETWIIGTVEEVVARLRELEEAGVERVFLQYLAHDDVELVTLLGTEVVPAVAA